MLRRWGDFIRVIRQSRGAKVVVFSTMGIDMGLFSWTLRILRPSIRIIAFDLLIPRRSPRRRLARWIFRPVDAFAIIRRGDRDTLERDYGIAPGACTFVPFPVDGRIPRSTETGSYVYSAGWAHRDWGMLIESLLDTGLEAIVAPGRHELGKMPENVTVIDMPSPEAGRELARNALCVAVIIDDTHLPAGPLVLLDAMAMGKAVVATNVNGVKDYLVDGKTGLLVPPGDAQALSTTLLRLARDPALRRELGAQAREAVIHSSDEFWINLAALVDATLRNSRQ